MDINALSLQTLLPSDSCASIERTCIGRLADSCHNTAMRVAHFAKGVGLALLSMMLFILSGVTMVIPGLYKTGREVLLHASTASLMTSRTFKSVFECRIAPSTPIAIRPSHRYWYENLDHMRDASELTSDPELQEEIRFLALNFLDKAAPFNYKAMAAIDSGFDKLYDFGPFSSDVYHRWSFSDAIKLGKIVGRDLVAPEEMPLVLTDTDSLNSVLLGYYKFGALSIIDQVEHYYDLCLSKDGAQATLRRPVLFDYTFDLRDAVHNNLSKVYRCRDRLKEGLSQMASRLSRKHPHIPLDKIQQLIEKNSTMVVRCRLERGFGVKVIPLYSPLDGEKLLKVHPQLLQALSNTGLYISRPSLRRLLNNVFDARPRVYPAQRDNNITFGRNFLENALMQRVYATFSSPTISKPCAVMGMATWKLIHGLFKEISQEQWDQLNAIPGKRKVIQTALAKIQRAWWAILKEPDNFQHISRYIERIHAEFTSLLLMSKPYSRSDFDPIYTERLKRDIPPSFHVKGGLGKTAMNVFAGVRSAQHYLNGALRHHVYSDELYFEERGSQALSMKDALDNSDVKDVAIFATQFHGNIEIHPDKSHYRAVNVIGEIEELLLKKPGITELTVTIDNTINFANTEEIARVLNHFKSEISSGKLNFVIFRSGQKLDMLGMDNYYGSPYIIVNNGDPKFDHLERRLGGEDGFQADDLTHQWFCHSNKYCFDEMEEYRRLVFANNRAALECDVPEKLKPNGKDQRVRVSTIGPRFKPSFIDIKIKGLFHRARSMALVSRLYYHAFKEHVKVHGRASFGFAHMNVNVISAETSDEASSMRISLGLDPKERRVLRPFLKDLAAIA